VIHIASDASDEGIVERGEAIIIDLMKIDKNRELNKLYRDDLVYALKKDIAAYKKSSIINPSADVILENDKVIILGELNVTVERV